MRTCVEAGVVGVGEGDDKAALVVHQAVHGHVSLLQLAGGQHGDQLVQQVGGRLEQVGQCIPHGGIQRIGRIRGHPVPHLSENQISIAQPVSGACKRGKRVFWRARHTRSDLGF